MPHVSLVSHVPHGPHVPRHVTTEPHASGVSHSPHLPAGLHTLQMPMPSRPPTPPLPVPAFQSVPPHLSTTMLPPAATSSPSMDSLLAMIHNLAKEVADGKVKQAEMAARM